MKAASTAVSIGGHRVAQSGAMGLLSGGEAPGIAETFSMIPGLTRAGHGIRGSCSS